MLLGVFVTVLTGVTASSASAVITVSNGHAYSYMPLRGAAAKFDTTFTNLDYNGGPVMPSNTDTLIFWSPSGLSAYPPEYPTGLGQYVADLAHDSGASTNVDSIANQYNDAAGNRAAYQVTNGGSFTDTDPYPTSQCPDALPVTNCFTDAQIQAELGKFIDAHGLPRDLKHEYFLLTPPHVESCFDNDPNDPNGPYGGCSAGNPANPAYCAYHGNSFSQPVFIYSNDPYVTGNKGCDDGNHPNGPSDGALEGGFSHEHNESITDPLPNSAWTDIIGNPGENGDKCGFNFGTPLGTHNGADYNQVINGHFYWYQQEWSNQGHTCLQRAATPHTPPTASFAATAGSGTTLSFDASASTGPVSRYSWQFNDGPGLNTPSESTTPTISHDFPTDSNPFVVGLTTFKADGTSFGTAHLVTPGQSGTTPGFTTTTAAVADRPTAFSAVENLGIDPAFIWYWDFGDGTTGSGSTASHTYTTPGTYTVQLTIFGAGGGFTTAQPVIVKAHPTAAFTVTTAKPVAGQATSFDGTGSSEPGGSISSYSWNFGDGTAAGSGSTASHIYRQAGTYMVILTVADPSGVTSSASHQLVVAVAPVARIRVKTKHPATGSAVSFTGGRSTDANGTITAYTWSFGDSSAAATGASPKHTYKKAGHYTVTLTITDSAGITVSTTKAVKVVRAAKISKVSVKGSAAKVLVSVKVTGAGSVMLGHKRVKLHKRGTANFSLTPSSHGKAKITFRPFAGKVQHKTVKLG